MRHGAPTFGLIAIAMDDEASPIVGALAAQATEAGVAVTCPSGVGVPAALKAGMVDLDGTATRALQQIHVALISGRGSLAVSALESAATAIRDARARHRARIGWIVLAVRATFQPHGQATSGRLTELLPHVGGDIERLHAFDAIVLLDAFTIDGTALPEASANEIHASAIAHLTFTEVATEVRRLVLNERSRLGSSGLFVSLGASEIPFSGPETLKLAAAVVRRAMAEQLLVDAGAPTVDESPDAWCQSVEQRLFAKDLDTLHSALHDSWREEALSELFKAFKVRRHLGLLLAAIAARDRWLRQLEQRAKAELADFMTTFAPPYTNLKLGLHNAPDVPPVVSHLYESRGDRVLILALLVLGLIGVVIAKLATGQPFGVIGTVLLLVFSVGIGIVLMLGLGETREIVTRIPAPIPRDWIRELEAHRTRCQVLSDLLVHNTRIRQSVEADIASLRQASNAAEPPGVAHTLRDYLVQRLAHTSLPVKTAVNEFWERPGELSSINPESTTSPLGDRLLAYSRELCASLTDMTMNAVLTRLGGTSVLQEPEFTRSLADSFDRAAPCLAVAGEETKVVVAVPRSLDERLRRVIFEQLHQPSEATAAREALTIVRVTMGYVGHADPTMFSGAL